MVPKYLLAAVLASSNALAAPLAAHGSLAAFDPRSLEPVNYTNATSEADLGRRIISLRGELERRTTSFNMRSPDKDSEDDEKKKRDEDEGEHHHHEI